MNVRVVESKGFFNSIRSVSAARLAAAKRSFSSRRADLETAQGLIVGDYRPQAGDLLLARTAHVGQHKRIERPDGRRAHLFAGDEIILAYGNRYAPDQFEALVPGDLDACELVAAGGIAARVVRQHRNISDATCIQPIGVLADGQGRVLNLQRFALRPPKMAEVLPPVIAVLGTSMNAGKTTALSRLVLGLSRAGLRAASCKVTGTGAGGDYWMMTDAGSVFVGDFTDMGHASTFGLPQSQIEAVLCGLISEATTYQPDVILLEIADGLLQPETSRLTESQVFRRLVDGVLFAANDAMGAIAGARHLATRGLEVRAVSGTFTASPLGVEEALIQLDEPVLLKTDLSNPDIARGLVGLGDEKEQHDEAASSA